MRASKISTTPCSMGVCCAEMPLEETTSASLILCLKQAVLKYPQEEEEEEFVPAERKLGLSPCSKTDLTQNL
jgi:hypothetical protein